MIKNLFNVLAFVLISQLAFAQSFWNKIDEDRAGLRNAYEREIIPEKYEVFSLDKQSLIAYLSNAPHETAVDRQNKELILEIPMADGSIDVFKVYEVSIMEPKLAHKYPSIKTYKGYSITGKATRLYFDVTPNGFHASLRNLHEEIYIDPYAVDNDENYIVYNVKDHKSSEYDGVALCGVEESESPQVRNFRPGLRSAGAVTRKEYRLAVACTGEWGSRRGTIEGALADINSMNMRMNAIYEEDMAIRFVLIGDNDKLIFLNPNTDPYTDADMGRIILRTNTGVLNNIVGASSYDVGHVLSVCFDIGGVAQLGSACRSNKGNGVTCHNTLQIGNIVSRVMAHEVGHQFDASHTWNRCETAADQRSAVTSFEPGSGTTIMSYAGTCNVDNVAGDNDDYFHIGSIIQMTTKTEPGGDAFACAGKVLTNNRFPELTMPKGGWIIPIGTPFELEGSATDEDGDELFYVWEQYDSSLNPFPLGESSAEGPLFRSVPPRSDGFYRIFPRSNIFFSPGSSDKNETLPMESRDLRFMLTVRDKNHEAGGVVWDDITFNVSDAAGPFVITFPSSGENLNIREKLTVEWDVANTDKAPIDCQYVDIYASMFQPGSNASTRTGDPDLIPLALRVPNTGSFDVALPDRLNQRLRLVVKASDNIFLAGSSFLSRIVGPSEPSVFFTSSLPNLSICQPDAPEVELTAVGFGGYTDDVEFSIVGDIPAGSVISLSKDVVKVGEKLNLNINVDDVVGYYQGNLTIRVIAPNIDTFEKFIPIEIIPGNIDNVELSLPLANQEGVGALPAFEWQAKPDAINYDFQLANNPGFSPESILMSVTTENLSLTSSVLLEKADIYYWRTRANNSCKNGEWSETRAFITEALSCNTYLSGERSINISTSGQPRVELDLNVPDQGIVSDLNIKKIRASHSRNSDIIASLVAPSGKIVVLWSNQCGTQRDFNLGINDNSPIAFSCPLNNGRVLQTHRNAGKLEAFKGESMNGDWKLVFADTAPGSGGRLEELDLEICASFSPDPLILEKDTLKAHPADGKTITEDILNAFNPANNNQTIEYTIVSTPRNGTLFFNGVEVLPGVSFNQADIRSGALRFRSNEGFEGADVFEFTVSNGEGSWIGVTPFDIFITESEPVSVQEAAVANDIYVYPNPTSGQLNVVLSGHALSFTFFEVYDVTGRVMGAGHFSQSRNELDLQAFQKGIYLLKLSDGQRSVYKKVTKM